MFKYSLKVTAAELESWFDYSQYSEPTSSWNENEVWTNCQVTKFLSGEIPSRGI